MIPIYIRMRIVKWSVRAASCVIVRPKSVLPLMLKFGMVVISYTADRYRNSLLLLLLLSGRYIFTVASSQCQSAASRRKLTRLCSLLFDCYTV